MNREQIAEVLAEIIYDADKSQSVKEVVKNTDYFLSILAEDVQVILHDKLLANSVDKEQTDKALKGLGWY